MERVINLAKLSVDERNILGLDEPYEYKGAIRCFSPTHSSLTMEISKSFPTGLDPVYVILTGVIDYDGPMNLGGIDFRVGSWSEYWKTFSEIPTTSESEKEIFEDFTANPVQPQGGLIKIYNSIFCYCKILVLHSVLVTDDYDSVKHYEKI
jgi:hypothetical protein